MAQRARQATQQVATGGYPLMTVPQIGEIFHALSIPVDTADLNKPTAQTAITVYTNLLDVLVGAHPELVDNPRTALLGMMEYKDLYSDALQFTIFYKHCKNLADICGVTSFGMSDLTRPDPARFRSQMSGIMNFAKFRDERSQLREAHLDRISRQKEDVMKMRRELDRIETSIEEIKAKNIQDKPLIEEHKARNEGVRNELLALRIQQQNLSREVDDLKAERQAVMEQTASKGQEATSLQSAISSAKSRLVQSPDRIKKHISEMTHMVATERSTLLSHQRKAREYSQRLEAIGRLEVDLKSLIDLEKGIDVKRIKVEEARRSVVATRSRMDHQESESKGMIAKLGQLDMQIKNADDKYARLAKNKMDMVESARVRRAELESEFLNQKKERRGWAKERERIMAEKKAVEEEMEEFVKLHEGEINALLIEYWTMRKQAEDYMNTVTVKLGLEIRV